MSYRLDWEEGGVCARLTGTLAEPDLRGLITGICEDPRFDALKFCIVDASSVESFAVDEAQVLANAASLIGAAFTNGRVVVAVVSTQVASHAICGQLVEMGAMPFPPAVFPHIDMARRWISVELPYRRSLAAAVNAGQFRRK